MRIICDEKKGLAVKLASNEKDRQVTLSDVTNNLLSGLMAAYISQTTEENRVALYSQLSLAFSNCLGYYAPDLYFPDEEESQKFAAAIERLASDLPDNSAEIEEAKAIIKERIKDKDATYVDLDLEEGQEFVEDKKDEE